MRTLVVVGLSIIVALLSVTQPRAADCDPVGNMSFVCGQSGPEDLAVVPGSEWVVAAAFLPDKGGLRLINTRDLTTTVLLPTSTPREQLDKKTYAACPGPVASAEQGKFLAHGLALRPGKQSVHTLYVVHHGTRESVEVFELDVRTKAPVLTWIGCVLAPEGTRLNAIVSLPEGGLTVTSIQTVGRGSWQKGENSGELWEWRPGGSDWKMVPGSETPGPNGLEISQDGKSYYIGTTGGKSVVRISRGLEPVKKDVVSVGFSIDNLRWAPDGKLFVAGFIGSSAPAGTGHVAKLDPKTLMVEETLRYSFNDVFSIGTTAVQVGKEIWVGSLRGDRIARFPIQVAQPSR